MPCDFSSSKSRRRGFSSKGLYETEALLGFLFSFGIAFEFEHAFAHDHLKASSLMPGARPNLHPAQPSADRPESAVAPNPARTPGSSTAAPRPAPLPCVRQPGAGDCVTTLIFSSTAARHGADHNWPTFCPDLAVLPLQLFRMTLTSL